MPVTDVTRDLESCALTITAEFAATADRVWEVYADPRRLERVWGPPTYPATVVDHELAPGGRSYYYMTSPEGEKYFGFWDISEGRETEAATALPFGRQSYDEFAPVWPSMAEFAAYNAMPKYVV